MQILLADAAPAHSSRVDPAALQLIGVRTVHISLVASGVLDAVGD